MASNSLDNAYSPSYPAADWKDWLNSPEFYVPLNTSLHPFRLEFDPYVGPFLFVSGWELHMPSETNFNPLEYQDPSHDPHFHFHSPHLPATTMVEQEYVSQFRVSEPILSAAVEASILGHSVGGPSTDCHHAPLEEAMSIPTAYSSPTAPSSVQGIVTPGATLPPVVGAPGPSTAMVRFALMPFCANSTPDGPFCRFSRKSLFLLKSRCFLPATLAPPSRSATC